MKLKIEFAGAGFLLLLCACNPAPKYAKPPAPTPSAFKEATPQEYKDGTGWKLAQPGDDKMRAKWWELYNDPQLSALEEQVVISNQTIAAAEANYRNARALVVSAHSALFPTIGAAPAYTNSRISSTSRTSSLSVIPGNGVINNFSLPFDASYTVDFWHRIRNQIAANAYNAQASAADVATALLSTQTELATDYFQIRALDEQRRVLDETLTNYRQALDLTKTLYRTGINSEQEVTQAQTQVDTATAQATDLGVARAEYEHAIATLIGNPASNFSLAVAPFVPNPPPVPVAVPSVLLERRPDIAALERQIAAANAEIGIARAAYYPSLTLSASGGFQTSHFTQWFNWPSRFWSLGPVLSQTLFDAGARRALNEEAEASYDAAVANYRQTVLTSFQAVEDQLSSLRILSQEVVEERTAINSSTHYLDLALIRFKTGVDSYLNVITAQTAVLTNRETEVQLQLRQMTSSVSLVLALGGGWDRTQLPQMKDLLAKPPAWKPGGAPLGNTSGVLGTPNPPPLHPPTR
ncbi:MAG TPA: efflux transporter outer membrane subunit [Bryobacteraceae bacterium]|jgi:NodT family efflux transporter outer membrane factor (OMF) lipoprotein